jgi:hypothetical protein
MILLLESCDIYTISLPTSTLALPVGDDLMAVTFDFTAVSPVKEIVSTFFRAFCLLLGGHCRKQEILPLCDQLSQSEDTLCFAAWLMV